MDFPAFTYADLRAARLDDVDPDFYRFWLMAVWYTGDHVFERNVLRALLEALSPDDDASGE